MGVLFGYKSGLTFKPEPKLKLGNRHGTTKPMGDLNHNLNLNLTLNLRYMGVPLTLNLEPQHEPEL